MRIPGNRVSDVTRFMRAELHEKYPPGEIEAIIRLAFEAFHGFNATQLLARQDYLLTESELLKFIYLLKDLRKDVPVQYSLGYTWFFDLKIRTDKRALIPRQETEELVDWIVKSTSETPVSFRILDIGTGTG